MMKRITQRLADRHMLLIGYGILVLVMIAGFIRVESLAAGIEYEAIERSRATCMVANTQGETLVEFTEMLREFVRPGESEEQATARDLFVESVRNSATPERCPPQPTTPPRWWERTFNS